MNVNQAVAAIVASYETKQPLMLWGPPGVGKSSAGLQARDILSMMYPATKATKGKPANDEFGFIDLRLSLMDPVDLRGIPQIKDGVAVWCRPSWLPSAGRGIIILEELVQASPSMMAAASQLVLDRRIGEHKLGDGWHVIAAGNRLSDRAAANSMPTHVANRFVHLYVEVSVEAWVQWALKADVDIRLVAFIKWRPALLHQFDPQSKAQAFASPRSWEYVSKQLGNKRLPAALLPDMVKGTVGDGPASEVLGFLRVFDQMPSIDSIRLNPRAAPIPTDPATLYAVVTSLSAGASIDNIGSIAIYFTRVTEEAGRPEFSIAAMKEISSGDDQRVKKIANTKPFIEWASRHAFVIS